ncbi:MAG TPA: endopeptidase La [Bdellovibrionota bacterium]|jgi:ATP-dependent Lon protease|nr:endopeptidase La [Bdellovibrionota bacterium]
MAPNREMDDIVIPESLPMLPVRDVVVFPYMILPLFVGREASIKAVNEALSGNRLIFLSSQKEIRDDNPAPEGIFNVGTVAMILRMRKLPDGRVKILAQGIAKATIEQYHAVSPYYQVKVNKIEEPTFDPASNDLQIVISEVKSKLEQIINLGKMLSPDIMMVVEELADPGRLADLVASNLGLRVVEAQKILETVNPLERLKTVSSILDKELEILAMQAKSRQTGGGKDQNQREQFLKDQIRAIKNELGDQDPRAEEMAELRTKIEAAAMTDEVRAEAVKQLTRLERMHPDASEASIIRTYLDWLCDLPWTHGSQDKLNLVTAKEILDEDHYDLEKVKERILEFLAVRKLKKDNKGPIICLSGPPGVGKTSLGKSIARSMGREFVRISLGGVHDEAEIRGHRRTYVGALPGRIIQAIKQSGTNNPVILLDEIDKLGRDYKGDPSSALLEVLDPEQNNGFRDHYLNLPFDLSNVLFMCTANVLDTIPAPLRDRMEVIQIPGYSEEDKVKIARRYLIDKQVRENGIPNASIEFTEEGLAKIIAEYTREAGLRNFERLIGTCARKVAHEYATWDGAAEFPRVSITEKKVEEFLGPPRYLRQDVREEDEVGVCNGLAWTQMGGEVLEVEATFMPGKGGVQATGSLGDVMKESCQTAWSWIRANAKELNIDASWFTKNEVHIHFPSGAVPKDGPSAGITITTAIVSLITNIPVRRDVAMTGEISLRGKVLPIGGLKEKSLAALRHGATTVIISHRNTKDLAEISDEYLKKMNFVSCREVREVLETALVRSPFGTKKLKSTGTGGRGGGNYSKEPTAAAKRIGVDADTLDEAA